jgi:hypothetical protein
VDQVLVDEQDALVDHGIMDDFCARYKLTSVEKRRVDRFPPQLFTSDYVPQSIIKWVCGERYQKSKAHVYKCYHLIVQLKEDASIDVNNYDVIVDYMLKGYGVEDFFRYQSKLKVFIRNCNDLIVKFLSPADWTNCTDWLCIRYRAVPFGGPNEKYISDIHVKYNLDKDLVTKMVNEPIYSLQSIKQVLKLYNVKFKDCLLYRKYKTGYKIPFVDLCAMLYIASKSLAVSRRYWLKNKARLLDTLTHYIYFYGMEPMHAATTVFKEK